MKRFTKIMAIIMVTALLMSFAIISTPAATPYTALHHHQRHSCCGDFQYG